MFNKLKIKFRIFRLGLKILFYSFFKSKQYNSIVICGDDEFQKVSIQALELLKEKAAESYNLILEHIGFICQDKSSGIFSSVSPSICIIKKESIVHNPGFYAGILCHEAYHVFLYHSYKKDNPLIREVPETAYSGEIAETKCVRYARQIMEKLGIDINSLPPIQEIIDSKWWEIPWDKQNW